jgi:transposase
VVVGLLASMLVAAHAQPAPDPFIEATTELATARSYKVRAQAALVLGRRGEARATPHLIRALDDRSGAVRAVAAQALGEVGDGTAHRPLQKATGDSDPFVRRSALTALKALADRASSKEAEPVTTTRPPAREGHIQVKAMGDRTHKASPRLRDDMRRFVSGELRALEGHAGREFSVDGAIKILEVSSRGAEVAVTCGVELILSAGSSGRIIVMSTGEATVQRQHRAFRPGMQATMEQEALAHAVRGAADELREHVVANAP